MIDKEDLEIAIRNNRPPINFYEGKARDHNIIEGELNGLSVAIELLTAQLDELATEHEAAMAQLYELTVAQYRKLTEPRVFKYESEEDSLFAEDEV